MSRIRPSGTAPEMILRRLMWRHGFRYRLQVKTPAGRPDITLPREKVAIFVDGCFWHGCPWHYVRPKSSGDFWSKKLRVNVLRDIRQTAELERSGWKVLRFWEHEVFENPDQVIARLRLRLERQGRSTSRSWRAFAVVPIPGSSQERWVLVDLRSKATKKIEKMRTTSKWRNSRTSRAIRQPTVR